MQWALQHREGLSVMVHTNTGCEVLDHSIWAVWAGQSYPIDFTILDRPLEMTTLTNETVLGLPVDLSSSFLLF